METGTNLSSNADLPFDYSISGTARTAPWDVGALAIKYSVTYNGNGSTGGSVPADSSSPYLSGSTVTVLGNTGPLVNTGYTFDHWNTAANGSGTSYSAVQLLR